MQTKTCFHYAESRQSSPFGQILEQRMQRNARIISAESRQSSPSGQIFSLKHSESQHQASLWRQLGCSMMRRILQNQAGIEQQGQV